MRRLAAVLGAGVAAVTLAACSSAANPFSIQKAYADTLTARTARLTLTGTVAVPGHSGSSATLQISGTGSMFLDGHAGELSMQLPEGMGTMQLRTFGTTFYLNVPGPTGSAGLPPGKSWVRIDLAQMLGPNALQVASQDDPTGMLAQLKSGSVSGLENLGSETLNGTDTTHYRVTVDVAGRMKKVAAAPGATAAAKALAAQDAKMGPMPVDVWVDSRDVIHRFQMKMHLPTGAVVTETTTFSDFGVPVAVQPPPAAAIVDATSLPGYKQAMASQTPGA